VEENIWVKDEVRGEWRKLHNEELNEMGGACRMFGEEEDSCAVLVRKPEGKRQLGRPGGRWEDTIKMDLQEVCWGHGLD
jgi:hypothetical protein